ncbi:MAG TPA: MaoC family dehydratase [Pyrinomonadaceae bacterium]|jgi:3-hydroxybutyryl-CoA dehydratase
MADLRAQVEKTFNELEVGQRFRWSRTLTDGDIALFVGVTGDFNPFHVDDQFAAQTKFGRRIVPGLLTASLATHIGGMMAFLASEMHFRYHQPVFAGETVSCEVEIVEKIQEGRRIRATVRCTKMEEIEVLTGEFTGTPAALRLKPESQESEG